MMVLHNTLPAIARAVCLCSGLSAGCSLSAQHCGGSGSTIAVDFIQLHHASQWLSHQLAVSIRFADSGGAGEVKGQVAHVVICIGRASACCAQVRALRVESLALEALQLWECAAAACVVLAARPCSADCR